MYISMHWAGDVSHHALGRGCVSQHTLGGGVSQDALRQTPPPPTATAADGTHPTGMHSCLLEIL